MTLDGKVPTMVDVRAVVQADKTTKLLQHMRVQRPVTLDGKVPTMEDVRAVVQADFSNADANWKQSVPKIVVSRSGCTWKGSLRLCLVCLVVTDIAWSIGLSRV